jgi:hypothetical protein
MKRSDQERLLREILADANVEQARAAALQAGVAHLRQRRQRHAMLTSAAAALVVLVSLTVLMRRQVVPEAPPTANTPAPAPRVRFVNDEQLLALFPDRPVALVGRPGEQKLIFLDATGASATRAQ